MVLRYDKLRISHLSHINLNKTSKNIKIRKKREPDYLYYESLIERKEMKTRMAH